MKILIACEESQAVCKAFREKGHEAYSCDVLPCSGGHPEWHIQGDVLEQLDKGWDMMVAHPPCTYLSRAGARWLHKNGEIDQKRLTNGLEAKDFFIRLLESDIPRVAVENPTPLKIYDLPAPSQVIQPYEYGHPYSKRTLLWLKGLPLLVPSNVISDHVPFLPSNTGGAKRGQKHSSGISKSQKESSTTFAGIAEAMAEQWGNISSYETKNTATE